MHKHKSKSKSHHWGAWSEWTWDSTQQANVRVRQDTEGHLEYEWEQQDLNPAGHARTPRDAAVEDITQRLNSLTTTTNEAHFERARHTRNVPTYNEHQRQNQTFAALPAMTPHTVHAPQAAVNYSQYGSARAAYTSEWSRSRGYAAFGEASAASSSQAAAEAQLYTEEDFEATSSKISSQTPNTYDELLLMKAGEAHSGSEGSPTPQPETAADGEYIPGTTEGDAGELDPRYRIEHSTRFQPGEIFKVHWSEPQGSISEAPKSSSKKEDLQNKFGTAFFVGFRRFIVVANDQGHCTCVPILTYGGKACKKSGVKPEKHGIVYERGQKSKKLNGEPSLGFSPVRVEMTEEGEKISRESRVNYSKLVTVEHNVKVFFIGHVYASDWQIVGDAVNHCWNKKIHQKQRHK
ncbi:hypothetical protein ACQRIT_006921 [Beauveria bassiana]